MSETDSHSDGTGYEQYELTESEVERILDGEVIEKDGQEFGVGRPLNSVGFTYENKWNNLLCREDTGTIRWSGVSGGDSIQIEIVEDEHDSDVVGAALDEIEDTDTDYSDTELHP